jgi:hypothetical protein
VDGGIVGGVVRLIMMFLGIIISILIIGGMAVVIGIS